MRRWGRLAIVWGTALAVVATIPMDVSAQQCPKGKLRIYTSWPMQGAMIPEGTGMKNGVDLAVSEAGGAVAGYCLEIINLDDASPPPG
jgi:branched-chain amino acid transport system substrate-binding protein